MAAYASRALAASNGGLADENEESGSESEEEEEEEENGEGSQSEGEQKEEEDSEGEDEEEEDDDDEYADFVEEDADIAGTCASVRLYVCVGMRIYAPERECLPVPVPVCACIR